MDNADEQLQHVVFCGGQEGRGNGALMIVFAVVWVSNYSTLEEFVLKMKKRVFFRTFSVTNVLIVCCLWCNFWVSNVCLLLHIHVRARPSELRVLGIITSILPALTESSSQLSSGNGPAAAGHSEECVSVLYRQSFSCFEQTCSSSSSSECSGLLHSLLPVGTALSLNRFLSGFKPGISIKYVPTLCA